MASGTAVIAGGDATIEATTDHTISSSAWAVGGDIGISVRKARTRAELDNDTNIDIGSDASLVAGGAVRLHIDSGTTANTSAEAWVGGLISATAFADHDSFDDRGVHIGSSGDHAERKITIGGGAQITGNTVDIDAKVSRADFESKVKAGAFGILNANAFSDANVTVYSDAIVKILNGASSTTTITGFRGVDIEARHTGNLDINRDVFNLAVAIIFPQEGCSRGRDEMNDVVDADKGALIVAGARADVTGRGSVRRGYQRVDEPGGALRLRAQRPHRPELQPGALVGLPLHGSQQRCHRARALGLQRHDPRWPRGRAAADGRRDGKVKAINAIKLFDANGDLVTPQRRQPCRRRTARSTSATSSTPAGPTS